MTAQPSQWIRNFVDGAFVEPDPAHAFDAVDPATGVAYARVHEADEQIVDRAVRAARRSLADGWANRSVGDRAAILRRAADLIEERFDDFVAAELADTGKPVTQARSLDVARAPMNFRAYADMVSATGQESYVTELADGRRALNYAVRKPLGVVAIIVPWNLPLLLLTWKVAPALACGNAVVVKPSEDTPGTASLLAEVLAEAGLPRGVYNVVHGFGADSAGAYLTEHPQIDGVTFTGSSATGTHVMKTVAPRVRPVSLELGGKNAAIVFDDVDVDEAVDGLSRSIFTNTGQVCLCTERVYVQRSIFDAVVAGLAAKAASLRLGVPMDGATTTGPLISQKHRDKVLGYLDLAVAEGATVVCGGGVPEMSDELDGGSWIEPTLWTGLDNSHRVMREEIFGPVAGLVPFDTEDEAIALANDTEYGLASVVWTSDLRRGHRVAAQMNVGLSWVNTWYLRDLRAPFGGVGLSGIGREGGESSLHFYTEPTNVCIQL
ncbi:2-hydroxymuconic semialdehyde dehydrogenase [Gordonia hydrophobica]|uniref:2-hydroxymuconic semialdehyde dehydrogenase n=1 Tax=Gordonia hydrophobica TaxID=40516 RepID=A0ABZ2TZ54_9ACTN|nr:2-hydroxymuconic semialdehyde dehydrogenase [Gordonia hydrophobica]MBM7367209.1 aminomuconate-semialdehyde/2-hydroxymuconate-6-semialdehyde dehydrogenase [Gordonia hydrophobica]